METVSSLRQFYTSSDLETILAVAEEWSGPALFQKLKESLSAQSFQLNPFLYSERNPPSKTTASMEKGDYTEIEKIKVIGKKLVFVAHRRDREALLFDGEALLNYGKVNLNQLTEIAGDLAFSSTLSHRDEQMHERVESKIYWKEQLFWEGEGYVLELVDVGGTPAFIQSPRNNFGRVVWGREMLAEGWSPSWLINCRGQPAYAFGGQVFLGKEIIGDDYEEAWNLTNFNGTLGFVARKGNHQFMVMDGKKVSHKEPCQVQNLWNIGGKPTILARKGNLYWMMQGEERKGDIYEGGNYKEEGRLVLESPINEEKVLDCEGKLAFVVTKFCPKSDSGVIDLIRVVFDGEVVGEEYSYVKDLISHGGKLAFVGEVDNKDSKVIVDGKTTWEFPYVHDLISVGDNLAFVVGSKEQGHPRYVAVEGKQIGEKHGCFSHLTDVEGKLAYGYSDRRGDQNQAGVIYDQKELSFLTVYSQQIVPIVAQWGRENLPAKGQSALEKALSKIKLAAAEKLAQYCS